MVPYGHSKPQKSRLAATHGSLVLGGTVRAAHRRRWRFADTFTARPASRPSAAHATSNTVWRQIRSAARRDRAGTARSACRPDSFPQFDRVQRLSPRLVRIRKPNVRCRWPGVRMPIRPTRTKQVLYPTRREHQERCRPDERAQPRDRHLVDTTVRRTIDHRQR